MDQVESMRVFVQVIGSGSFAGAARRLRLSPGMVGKHVRALEDRLGAMLLHRTTRRLRLTEVGERYYRRCTAILADIDDAEREARARQATPRGLVRLSAPVSFGVLHLAAALGDFVAAHPAVTLDIGLTDQFVDLMAEGHDLALRIGQLGDSSLMARRLAPCRMVACASPEYLQRHGAPESPEALARHDCLYYTATAGPGRWRFVRKKREHVVQVTGGVIANSMDLLRVLAVSGRGIVLGPTFVLGADLASGRLVPVLDGYELPALTIHAVYPPGRNVPAKVRAVIDFLATRFGPEPSWDRWRGRT
ncbi:hypothetical protein BON30_21935 [Cystobacter ferrugineus]|uniref:HTH lysR-type domain-containing protein n=2 Tax=Cystobacter ferrugineus TaxID=83449 RepID=A0A1L9B9F5_9BACT|nr:hypothetical protein BON30_21935 [Cystobacter ferrugineus]